MYFAALRPAEANWLREADCALPETGWGELVLSGTASRSNARYIGTGRTWEERTLKKRAAGTVRVVPIPPRLVEILRGHIERFGTTTDGRLFRGQQLGEPVGPSIYTQAWKQARVVGVTRRRQRARLPGGRTTCGMRRCPPGSRPGCLSRRWRSGPGTPSRCC